MRHRHDIPPPPVATEEVITIDGPTEEDVALTPRPLGLRAGAVRVCPFIPAIEAHSTAAIPHVHTRALMRHSRTGRRVDVLTDRARCKRRTL